MTDPDVYQMFTKSIKIAHRASSTGYQGASGGTRLSPVMPKARQEEQYKVDKELEYV